MWATGTEEYHSNCSQYNSCAGREINEEPAEKEAEVLVVR